MRSEQSFEPSLGAIIEGAPLSDEVLAGVAVRIRDSKVAMEESAPNEVRVKQAVVGAEKDLGAEVTRKVFVAEEDGSALHHSDGDTATTAEPGGEKKTESVALCESVVNGAGVEQSVAEGATVQSTLGLGVEDAT